MITAESIVAILVILHVDVEQVLYVMLDASGNIHRMGNGTECNTDNDLFIGTASEGDFERLRSFVRPFLLQRIGAYVDPHLQGKRCVLTIGLRQSDGQEVLSKWEYGTKSQGPPSEICELVRAAVAISNPWHEQQKKSQGQNNN